MRSNQQEFSMKMPFAGATRMTCREANCAAERDGWVTVLDPSVEKHVRAANWIKGDQGRKFIELRSENALEYVAANADRLGLSASPERLRAVLAATPPGMIVFIFPPGQQCFRPHLDREVIFVHAKPQGTYVHERARDWQEDMNEEAYRVDVLRQRG